LKDVDGVARWPAVPVELGFNVFAFVIFLFLRRRKILPGQHFHLYLAGYGAFRFAHEFVRATPRILGPFSGYHFAALAVGLFGAFCFWRRRVSFANEQRFAPRPAPTPA
jgi:prolipoprotein diacylglyceryltransferase